MKIKKEIKERREGPRFFTRVGQAIRSIFGFLGEIMLYLFRFIKSIFVLIEKTLKIVAIFIITLSTSALFFVLAFFLIATTFGLKESPAFQVLRDRIGLSMAMHVEQEIREIEDDEEEWRFNDGLENMNEELREQLDKDFEELKRSMGVEEGDRTESIE